MQVYFLLSLLLFFFFFESVGVNADKNNVENGKNSNEENNVECNDNVCEVKSPVNKLEKKQQAGQVKEEATGEIEEEEIESTDEVDIKSEESEGDKLYKFYYNNVQPASLSLLRIISLFNLNKNTDFHEVKYPSKDEDVPVFEIKSEKKKLGNFKQIKSFLMEIFREKNVTWTIYTVDSCSPCTKVKKFIKKNKLDNIFLIITCDKSNLKAIPGCDSVKNFPTLASSLGTKLEESSFIIKFIREIYLDKDSSMKIPRYPLELQDIGGKVMYPKLFSLYFFPGEKEGMDADEWVKKNNFSPIVERKPLTVLQYNNEYLKVVNTKQPNDFYISTPNIILNENRIAIAMGFNNIKRVLLRLKLITEPSEKAMWSKCVIYSSQECPACVQLKELLRREKLEYVRIEQVENSVVRNEFKKMGGNVLPSLSCYGQIQLCGAADIANFIAFMKHQRIE